MNDFVSSRSPSIISRHSSHLTVEDNSLGRSGSRSSNGTSHWHSHSLTSVTRQRQPSWSSDFTLTTVKDEYFLPDRAPDGLFEIVSFLDRQDNVPTRIDRREDREAVLNTKYFMQAAIAYLDNLIETIHDSTSTDALNKLIREYNAAFAYPDLHVSSGDRQRLLKEIHELRSSYLALKTDYESRLALGLQEQEQQRLQQFQTGQSPEVPQPEVPEWRVFREKDTGVGINYPDWQILNRDGVPTALTHDAAGTYSQYAVYQLPNGDLIRFGVYPFGDKDGGITWYIQADLDGKVVWPRLEEQHNGASHLFRYNGYEYPVRIEVNPLDEKIAKSDNTRSLVAVKRLVDHDKTSSMPTKTELVTDPGSRLTYESDLHSKFSGDNKEYLDQVSYEEDPDYCEEEKQSILHSTGETDLVTEAPEPTEKSHQKITSSQIFSDDMNVDNKNTPIVSDGSVIIDVSSCTSSQSLSRHEDMTEQQDLDSKSNEHCDDSGDPDTGSNDPVDQHNLSGNNTPAPSPSIHPDKQWKPDVIDDPEEIQLDDSEDVQNTSQMQKHIHINSKTIKHFQPMSPNNHQSYPSGVLDSRRFKSILSDIIIEDGNNQFDPKILSLRIHDQFTDSDDDFLLSPKTIQHMPSPTLDDSPQGHKIDRSLGLGDLFTPKASWNLFKFDEDVKSKDDELSPIQTTRNSNVDKDHQIDDDYPDIFSKEELVEFASRPLDELHDMEREKTELAIDIIANLAMSNGEDSEASAEWANQQLMKIYDVNPDYVGELVTFLAETLDTPFKASLEAEYRKIGSNTEPSEKAARYNIDGVLTNEERRDLENQLRISIVMPTSHLGSNSPQPKVSDRWWAIANIVIKRKKARQTEFKEALPANPERAQELERRYALRYHLLNLRAESILQQHRDGTDPEL